MTLAILEEQQSQLEAQIEASNRLEDQVRELLQAASADGDRGMVRQYRDAMRELADAREVRELELEGVQDRLPDEEAAIVDASDRLSEIEKELASLADRQAELVDEVETQLRQLREKVQAAKEQYGLGRDLREEAQFLAEAYELQDPNLPRLSKIAGDLAPLGYQIQQLIASTGRGSSGWRRKLRDVQKQKQDMKQKGSTVTVDLIPADVGCPATADILNDLSKRTLQLINREIVLEEVTIQ